MAGEFEVKGWPMIALFALIFAAALQPDPAPAPQPSAPTTSILDMGIDQSVPMYAGLSCYEAEIEVDGTHVIKCDPHQPSLTGFNPGYVDSRGFEAPSPFSGHDSYMDTPSIPRPSPAPRCMFGGYYRPPRTQCAVAQSPINSLYYARCC